MYLPPEAFGLSTDGARKLGTVFSYLIKALKEQQKQIESLQNEVKALKAQIQTKK